MRVRPATAADAVRIAGIHISSWQATYAGVFPDEYLQSLDVGQRVDRWRRILQTRPESDHVLVAADHDVRGFAHFGPSRDDDRADAGELYAIYVDPSSAGSGAGRALVGAGERLLAEHGYADAIVWVLDGNMSARGFYEHLGWAAEATVKRATIGGVSVLERRHAKRLHP